MAIKQYVKNIASAILQPVAKSLWGVSPNISMGFSLFSDKVFRWGVSGYEAYNNKIFYTGVNLIVRKMTEAPLTFNRKKVGAKKSIDKFYSKTISNPERSTVKSQVLDELPEHDLHNIIDNETMIDFWYRYNFGAGLLWFETLGESLSRNTKPVKAWSLDPKRLTIERDNGRFDNVGRLLYTALNGEQIPLEKDHIVYMGHWNPNINDLTNYGVDEVCAIDIALNRSGNEAEGSAYINGGRGTLFSSKSDVLKDSDGSESVVDKMTVAQMSALKDTILQDMQGASNNRKMKFTNGEVVVTPYGDTLAEMEINKSEDSRWKNIYAILGIPKELSPATFSSSENSVNAGYKALVTNLVVSNLKRFDRLCTKVVQKWWPDVVVVSDLTEYTELAPDLKLMKEVYGSPAISEDERRKIFGYDEIGGDSGKAILVPSGMMLLSDLVAEDPFNDIEQSDTL